jgi:hypothetical protein
MAREAGMNPQEAAAQVALGLKQINHIALQSNDMDARAKR